MASSSEAWMLIGLGAGAVALLVVIGRRLVLAYQRKLKIRRLQRRFADRLTRRSE
jgi:hypothetical protein